MDTTASLQQQASRSVYWYESLLERDLVPDWLIRTGIRRLLAARLREESSAMARGRETDFVERLRQSAIALVPDAANRQHYEVPAEFFTLVLGAHRKYSCALWEPETHTLDAAEEGMFDLYAKRAGMEDGQRVLDLGCGWGSLSLYLARRFPRCQIVGVSNSHSQQRYIMQQARESGLTNLQIVTADMNDFAPADAGIPAAFDRVISIEMFEHMRNYPELLCRISGWLAPGGSLFVHIFCHQSYTYPFEVRGKNDWMAEHFFSGGIMPSQHLLQRFQDHMTLDQQWEVSGQHYQRTCEAWLSNMDRRRDHIEHLFSVTYGDGEQVRWVVRWRIFFMACAELFGYRQGQEWFVSHYRFSKR